MSLEIVRSVDRAFPALLQQNVNRTCYAFVVEVIRRLRAEGHEAYHVAKSPGEGQFVPPGFEARDVIGLDGKTYHCSGVSHDAIWCDGVIVDTIARGNDSPDPIQYPRGDRMTGEPVWNEIPREHWRANNPPLTDGGPSPGPTPSPSPVQFPYPDEGTLVKALQDRVKAAYQAIGRSFPDPNDSDAYRHFARYGYDCRGMDAQAAADKRIKELRAELGAPAE